MVDAAATFASSLTDAALAGSAAFSNSLVGDLLTATALSGRAPPGHVAKVRMRQWKQCATRDCASVECSV